MQKKQPKLKWLTFSLIPIIILFFLCPYSRGQTSMPIEKGSDLEIAFGGDSERQLVENADLLSQEKKDLTFHLGTHLRTSFNTLDNTKYLDKHNTSDRNTYVGYAYDFTLDLRHISGAEFYTFIERRGRADYDAPLWGNRQIDALFGRYHWYHDANMTPRIREFWLQLPLNPTDDLLLKGGLMLYGRELGHRIALGGKYENYGVTLSGINDFFDWNLHWEKEDLGSRIHLGRVIDFDKVAIRYNDTHAYFYAADTTLKLGESKAQVYVGWLRDRTPEGARNSKFANVVKKEDLVTPGTYLDLKFGKLNLAFEGAKNLGKAKAIDSRYIDVNHKGYLLIGHAAYDLGSFKPKTKLFIASGNKFNNGNFDDLTIPGGDNRAFSVFSPLNTNLTDSHYQKQFGPYVAMAGGYAVNFGVSRPGTFGDPFIFENLVAYTVGFDYTPIDKWYVGIDYWYLRTKENSFKLDDTLQAKKLPRELGHEADIFASYQWTKNIKLSLLAGFFNPGKYYREFRRDTSANNVFAPTPRRDGHPDNAYQIELGIDINF